MPTLNININNHKSIINYNTDYININVYENSEDKKRLYTFLRCEFFDSILGIIQEWSPKYIQYYNPSEEQIFQYNTIMDFSTLQAVVHLGYRINNTNIISYYDLKECVDKFAKNAYNEQYSITI